MRFFRIGSISVRLREFATSLLPGFLAEPAVFIEYRLWPIYRL
jgi:hypothetical protein